MSNLNQILADLEKWTQLGQKKDVLFAIKQIRFSELDENIATQIAHIANRNHAPLLAMRILFGFIKRHRESNVKLQGRTLQVYCNSLINVGGLEEAKLLIEKIDDYPESNLTKAFICFADWDYESAVPFLRHYNEIPNLGDYQKLVGSINLLACYVSLGKHKLAQQLIASITPVINESTKYNILHGNLLELESQIYIQNNDLVSGKEKLERAKTLLSTQTGRSLLYVQKWLAVIALSERTDNSSLKFIHEVRQQAQLLRNWETIRDCDFHVARLTNNTEMLDRIYLGTPFKRYRENGTTLSYPGSG